MCVAVNLDDMPRALLTDRERDVVTKKEDIPRGTKSTLLSRIESKIEIMQEDARLLREHQPELASDLHRAVCEEPLEERLTDVEKELEQTKQRVESLENKLQTEENA